MRNVNTQIAKRIKELDLPIEYQYVYANTYVINDDVIRKHGYLSDDGYYELTKQGGGEYDWDYVYVRREQLMSRNRCYYDDFIKAPFVEDVLRYFRDEMNIHVNVIYNIAIPDSSERYQASIVDAADVNYPNVHRPVTCQGLPLREMAEDRALEYILFKLFK